MHFSYFLASRKGKNSVSFEIRKHPRWHSSRGRIVFQTLASEHPLSSGQRYRIALHTFRKENTRHLINFRRHHTLLQLCPSASERVKLKPTIRPGLHEFSSFSRCIRIFRSSCWTACQCFGRAFVFIAAQGVRARQLFTFAATLDGWKWAARRSYMKNRRAHTGLLLFYGRQCVQPYIWCVLAGLKAAIKRWLFISNCFEFPRAFMAPRP